MTLCAESVDRPSVVPGSRSKEILYTPRGCQGGKMKFERRFQKTVPVGDRLSPLQMVKPKVLGLLNITALTKYNSIYRDS